MFTFAATNLFYNVKLSNYEEIQFFCRYDPVGCQLQQ